MLRAVVSAETPCARNRWTWISALEETFILPSDTQDSGNTEKQEPPLWTKI